jgi:Arc/MetJ-type ribon-helix-helix transcriptional regulator
MPQIAVRLSDDELASLDRLVADHHFASRAAAIRDALAQVQKAEEDRQIADEYRRAYANRPPTQEEIEIGHLGAHLAGEFFKGTGEPPWDSDDDDDEPAPSVPPREQAFSEMEAALQHALDLVRAAAAQERAAS